MYPKYCSNTKSHCRRGNVFEFRLEFLVEWKVPSNRYLPGLCVANKAPADTEVTRTLVRRSPLNASQSIEALNNARADVFLSWKLERNERKVD